VAHHYNAALARVFTARRAAQCARRLLGDRFVPSKRPKLTPLEIALGVAAGLVAGGGAALALSIIHYDDQPSYSAATSERTYTVAPFENVSNTGPQDVVITRGDTMSVRAEGSPRALGLLEAVVKDGRLSIGPKEGFNWGNWTSLQHATFYVTMPRIESAALAGSGDIRIDQVEGEQFSGTVAGSGELSIGSLKVTQADLAVAGSGDISAAGTAHNARTSIGGSGTISADGLHSDSASVSIGGSGDVALTVQNEAKISVMGSGDVDISGPAQCSVTRMGSGDVSCDSDSNSDDDAD
jgi:hypothetical protein